MTTTTESQEREICIFAIHMPQARDRELRFLEANKIEGVRFAFVAGVDGEQLDVNALLRQEFIMPGTTKYTFSTLGCALAHRAQWVQAVAREVPTVICEDDVVFRTDFREQFEACLKVLPMQWEFLLLGYNFDSVLEADIIPGVERIRGQFVNRKLQDAQLHRFQDTTTRVTVLRLTNAFGLPAYALSPNGARRLLSNVFPLHNRLVPVPALGRTIVSFSIDSIINWLLKDMEAYVCIPPLVVSPNVKDPNDREVTIPAVLESTPASSAYKDRKAPDPLVVEARSQE